MKSLDTFNRGDGSLTWWIIKNMKDLNKKYSLYTNYMQFLTIMAAGHICF